MPKRKKLAKYRSNFEGSSSNVSASDVHHRTGLSSQLTNRNAVSQQSVAPTTSLINSIIVGSQARQKQRMSGERLELQSISTTLHEQPRFHKPATVLSLNTRRAVNKKSIFSSGQVLFSGRSSQASVKKGFDETSSTTDVLKTPIMTVNIAKVPKPRLIQAPPTAEAVTEKDHSDYFITKYSFPKQLAKSTKPAAKSGGVPLLDPAPQV